MDPYGGSVCSYVQQYCLKYYMMMVLQQKTIMCGMDVHDFAKRYFYSEIIAFVEGIDPEKYSRCYRNMSRE